MSTVEQQLDNWFNKYAHVTQPINRGGIQCVAVANAYEAEFVQGAGDEFIPTPLTGYAKDWWDNFGKDVDYQEYERVAANAPAHKGDVAIWFKYGGWGLPHIAVVRSDTGSGLECLTQNPRPAHLEVLTKKGLDGYLRPKKLAGAVSSPLPTYNAGGKYSLAVQVPGFATAADALAKQHSNSTVPAGEYMIFNKAAGMVNITREVGKPGWWINPAFNKVAAPAPAPAPAPQPAPTPAPAPAGIKVGDHVVPKRLVDYNGTGLTQYDPNYTVTELKGDRAVLSARGAVWAAMRLSDIKKV